MIANDTMAVRRRKFKDRGICVRVLIPRTVECTFETPFLTQARGSSKTLKGLGMHCQYKFFREPRRPTVMRVRHLSLSELAESIPMGAHELTRILNRLGKLRVVRREMKSIGGSNDKEPFSLFHIKLVKKRMGQDHAKRISDLSNLQFFRHSNAGFYKRTLLKLML